jgi:hypothetical protein
MRTQSTDKTRQKHINLFTGKIELLCEICFDMFDSWMMHIFTPVKKGPEHNKEMGKITLSNHLSGEYKT